MKLFERLCCHQVRIPLSTHLDFFLERNRESVLTNSLKVFTSSTLKYLNTQFGQKENISKFHNFPTTIIRLYYKKINKTYFCLQLREVFQNLPALLCNSIFGYESG